MKNLNEQIDRIKSVMGLINEQDDLYNNFISSNKFKNCRGISLTKAERMKDRQAKKEENKLNKMAKKQGKSVEEVEKEVYGEWSKFAKSEIDESKLDNIIDANIDKLKGLCAQDAETAVKAAMANSDTFNRLSKSYKKYFNEDGKLLSNYEARDIGSNELLFLKQYFPTQDIITPTDILNLFAQTLGGVEKYKDIVNNYYKINK